MSQRKPLLPPRIKGYVAEGVEWERLAHVDLELMGYLLSCHLIIEHYLDHFLHAYVRPALDWEAAKLQFSQKIALVSKLNAFKPPYDFVPAMKHLNSLRNRYAHRIDVRLGAGDFLPIRRAVEKMANQPVEGLDKKEVLDKLNDERQLLELFTMLVCSWFGGAITLKAQSDVSGKPHEA